MKHNNSTAFGNQAANSGGDNSGGAGGAGEVKRSRVSCEESSLPFPAVLLSHHGPRTRRNAASPGFTGLAGGLPSERHNSIAQASRWLGSSWPSSTVLNTSEAGLSWKVQVALIGFDCSELGSS